MDERNLRIAFAKVKKDMIAIKEDLYDLAKSQTSNNVGNGQSYHNELKFDNFVTNVENELKALTLFTKELEDRITHNASSKNVSVSSGKVSNKELEDSFEQLEGKFADFSELINEKIEMELNSLRLEFTEEIAKVYDRVFTEVLELKDEIKNKKGDSKKLETKVESKVNKKVVKKTPFKKNENSIENEDLYQPISETTNKPGKLKKVMNWLFVDEDENAEISDIKTEVKKIKDEDKEDLY